MPTPALLCDAQHSMKAAVALVSQSSISLETGGSLNNDLSLFMCILLAQHMSERLDWQKKEGRAKIKKEKILKVLRISFHVIGRIGIDYKRSFSYADVLIFERQGDTYVKSENGPAQTQGQSWETVRKGGRCPDKKRGAQGLEKLLAAPGSISACVCYRVCIL